MNKNAHLVLAIAVATLGIVPAKAAERWAGVWGFANAGDRVDKPATTQPGTFRYRIRPTQGGDALRLTVSNIEGTIPLDIGAVTVADAAAPEGEAIDPASVQAVSFSKGGTITVPGGRAVVSDPVRLRVTGGRDLIVSLYLRAPSRPYGVSPGVPTWFAEGADGTREGQGTWRATKVRPFLSLVAVRNPASPCTIVALGDSITDGAASSSPKMRGWPDRLAARWQARPAAQRCGIVNMGIGGNRVLKTGSGIAAIDRFWRDVASVPGATDVILLEGINDIGGSKPDAPLTSDDLIAGYRQIIARAHSLGLRIHGATLTPALGAGYMSDAKEVIRQDANRFIRSSGEFDGVIDFEAAVRDPAAPSHLLPRYDPGDHLHPNDAGYQAMADAVNLTAFARRR